MKRIAFFLFIITTFATCTNVYNSDTLITNQSKSNDFLTKSTSESSSLEQDISTILNLGLDTTNLMIREEYYIAGGICVPKSVLEEKRNSSNNQNRMTQSNSLHQHYNKFYYKLPFNNGTLYQATLAAINRWGYVDCGLMIDGDYDSCTDDSFFEINLYVEETFDYDPLVFPIYTNKDNNHPYSSVVINTLNPLWNVALNNDQYMYLVMHAIGESLKFDSIDTYDAYDPSIMMSEDLLDNHPNLWCDFTANDLIAITNAFPKQNEPQFSYEWSPNVECTYEQVYLLTENVDYTLTIASNATCCTSTTNTLFEIKIEEDNSSINGFVLSKSNDIDNTFNVRFNEEGQYSLTAWIYDDNISKIHMQTIEISVLGGVDEFVFNEPDTMSLQTPYKISYVHTLHPERTVEYSIREIMFDNGSSENATLVQSGDSCTVSLNKYGCYILNAIIKENGHAVDTAYINMTKMLPFLDIDRTTILLNESKDKYSDSNVDDALDTLSSRSYCLIMPPPISKYDRFACCIESEYEVRNNFSDERRIDRKWFLKLNLFQVYEDTSTYVIQIAKRYQLPTLYKIANTQPTIEGFARWRHEYYTGRVYMPIDGIRIVKGEQIRNQPLGYIDIQTEGFTPTRVGLGFEK